MTSHDTLGSALADFTVLELGNEIGDHAGLLLAGLGANVVKIEPHSGSGSRAIGPFASGSRDPEESVFFWRYNLNKKSAAIDLDRPDAHPILARIARNADIALLSGELETVERALPFWRQAAEDNPRLIVCAITPFGLDGPYSRLTSTDLTQLAMGGIMAVCGYDPDESDHYDTPPIAPAMWHSYHVAGEYAAVAIMAAINFRDLSGQGQFIDVSVHEAVNTCTEIAIPTYIYNGQVVMRQTARHAAVHVTQVRLSKSADGVYMLASLSPFDREARAFAQLADQCGIEHVLNTPEYAQLEKDDRRAAFTYRNDLIEQVVGTLSAQELFERAQSLGLAWSPIRRPEDNLADPHFAVRGTFATIRHPELNRDLRYPGTVATNGDAPHMSYTRRAPRIGEDTDAIMRWAGFGDEDIQAFRARRLVK